MENEYIYFTGDHSAPYSDLVVAEGKYLFFSGLISADLRTQEMRYGSITFETNQILTNLRTLLEQYGSDMDHLIRVEVLLRDFSQRDEMNMEYMRHFSPNHVPARLCYGNVGLAGECKIEIMATAVKK